MSESKLNLYLAKTDWPPDHRFIVGIGPGSLRAAAEAFGMTVEIPAYELKVGTTWIELLEAFGLVGERGVFPTRATAFADGWEGEILPGKYQRTLSSKNYTICVLRTE